MTDEIIIKSLRCCTTDGCHCRDCAFQEMDDAPEYDCGHRLMMAALELIYRQMSKIEALKMDYEQAMSDAANANCNADHLSRCLDELNKQQMPKKVKISLKGTTDLNTKCRCPNCGAFISNGKYCRECGQAIDWSE